MDKIAGLFIRKEYLRWAVILLLFIPLYGVSLGGNELWYNSFFVSNVVKAMGMAAIWWMLNGHLWRVFCTVSAITFLQPVVGMQLYGLVSGSMLLAQITFFKKSTTSALLPAPPGWYRWLAGNALWLGSAGVWILFLQLHFDGEAAPTPDRFFDILFVFRAPHHYWPPSWSTGSWIVESSLIAIGLWYFYQNQRWLFYFFCLGLLACVGYWLGVVEWRITEVGALQGFKVTIWLEFLGVVALVASIQSLFNYFISPGLQRWGRPVLFSLGLGSFVVIGCCASHLPIQVPRDFGGQFRVDPAIDICLQAKAHTDTNAVFIHPIGFTELKVYGERSSYVDYKVLVHTRAAMHRWYNRIHQLYGVSLDQNLPATDRYDFANEYFRLLSLDTLSLLSQKGVTHVLTFAEVSLPLEEIARNDEWVIYALKTLQKGGLEAQ